MADFISHRAPPHRGAQLDRRDWPLVLGVAASLLSVAYVVLALRAPLTTHPDHAASWNHAWFPLQLFIIAVSPATAGFIFLWSERNFQNKETHKLLRNLGIFGVGMLLAASVAFVLT